MRAIVIAVILGVLVGLTATQALAAGPQVKKPWEPDRLIARLASSKSVSCRGVRTPLAEQPSVSANGGSLPYDEFGLDANQPSQPRIGNAGLSTGLTATGLDTETSVSADGNSLPYDEFGLDANQPSQPRIGCDG